jgi:hypothetical protein
MGFAKGHAKLGGKRKAEDAPVNADKMALKARKAGPKIVEKLLAIVRDPKADSADIIAASRILLERGFGRAAEAQEPPKSEVERMSLEEVQAATASLLERELGPELFAAYKERRANTSSILQIAAPPTAAIDEASKPVAVAQPKMPPAANTQKQKKMEPPKEPPEETGPQDDNRWRMPSFLGGPTN